MHYDVAYEFSESTVMLTYLTPALVEHDRTLQLMRAYIEIFDAPRAEVAWQTLGP